MRATMAGGYGVGLATIVAALLGRPAAADPGEVVKAELVVIDRATRRTPVPLARPATCPAEARCLAGTVDDGVVKLTLAIGAGVRALPIEADVEVDKETPIQLVAVRLTFAASSFSLIGRDFAPAKVREALLDRTDPKWIALGDRAHAVASLILDGDADSARVEVEHGQVVVELQLFSAPARPFGHLPRCGHVWRDIHGRVSVPIRFLRAGERLHASGQLLLGETRSLVVAPWPQARPAAFVVTDHADQSSTETLHALLAGASDADLEHPIGGLLGHAIPITKALFLRGGAKHGGARPQLEEPAFATIAERMRAAGSELVPHSATPLPDKRPVTEQALAWFAARGSHTWIDHQPQTNCEGFCQSGWHTRTGIADLLAAHEFTDVWDLSEWTGAGLDQRDPHRLDHAAATVWPLGRLEPDGPASLWMFRSTWAFVPTAKFFQKYAPTELDRLERDHGLHIAHTYLETLHPKHTFFGRRNLMLRAIDGRVTLDAKFDAFLADLHRRSERGSLWTVPLGALAERVRALAHVRVRITESGHLSVTRPHGLADLTLQIGGSTGFQPSPALAGQRSRDGVSHAWLNACAGSAECTDELTLVDAAGSPLSMFVR